jgi:hypothetical protein
MIILYTVYAAIYASIMASNNPSCLPAESLVPADPAQLLLVLLPSLLLLRTVGEIFAFSGIASVAF